MSAGMAAEIRRQIAWLRHIRGELTGRVPGSVVMGVDQSIKYLTAAIEDVAPTVKPDLTVGATSQPERIWLSAADADGDHTVWFEPDEGGTEYIRAELAHALATKLRGHLADAEESRDAAIVRAKEAEAERDDALRTLIRVRGALQ